MSRLRVAMVTRRYWPLTSGAATVIAGLAAGLREHDVESTIVTPRWRPTWPEEIRHRRTRVVRLPISHYRMLQNLRYAWTLTAWLRRHATEFDLIYVSELKHDAAAAVSVSRQSGVPVVLRAENSGLTGDCHWQLEARLGRRIKQHCFDAAALLAASPILEQELIAAGYPRDRIHHLPVGVRQSPRRSTEGREESRAVLSEAHPSFGMPPGAPLAVFLGRLTEDKRLSTLIAAWASVVSQHPEARLWLVGDGPQQASLLAEVESRGLGGRVLLTGAFDEVDDVLQAADLFAYPVEEAGTACALLEAMAAGLPILASDIPDNRHRLDDGRLGILQPCQEDALSQGLHQLLNSAEHAAGLGYQAQEWVRQKHSLPEMVRRHLELFESLTS